MSSPFGSVIVVLLKFYPLLAGRWAVLESPTTVVATRHGTKMHLTGRPNILHNIRVGISFLVRMSRIPASAT